MIDKQFSFDQKFKTFTGAEWNDNPAARVISYHTAISIGAKNPANANELFAYALDIFEDEPDVTAKHGLLETLDQTVLRNSMSFGSYDPEKIYQKIFQLYESNDIRGSLPVLATLGLDIALHATYSYKQNIFNRTVNKVYQHLNWDSAEDYIPVLKRLNRLVSNCAWLATPQYASMCVDFLYTHVPESTMNTLPPHQRPKVKRYQDSLPAFYNTVKQNLLTLARGVKEKRPGMLPSNELFTHVSDALIRGASRHPEIATHSIAIQLLSLIDPPPRPKNPPVYLQKLNPSPPEIRPAAKEFVTARNSLFRRFRWLTPLSGPLRVLALAKHLRSAQCNLRQK